MKKIFVLNAFLKRIPRLRICLIVTGMLLGLHLNAAKEEAASMQDAKKIVSGVITDAIGGEVLPGVSVLVKGTTTGTITDLDGNYSISVSDQDVLIFSYMGYLNEEVAVGSQTVINFNITPDIIGLDEVVVIGYGVQQKKLVTGATVHVKDAEIAKMHSVRLEQAMQGLTPGVQVTSNSGQPGEGLKVRVRGVGTIGNADPLYIIDGVPTDDIRFLSPSDVESIDILKDAAS
jgi:hypothetical protein